MDSTGTAELTWLRDERLGVSMPMPSGFERVGVSDGEDFRPLAISPEEWRADFRPSVSVVGIEHEDGIPAIDTVVTQEMALLAAQDEPHILVDDPTGPHERTLVWGALTGSRPLVWTQRFIVGPRAVVTVTAVTELAAYPALQPTLRAVLDLVTLDETLPPDAEPTSPQRRPQIDTDLRWLTQGEDVGRREDLSRLGPQQAFRPGGVSVPREPLLAWLAGKTDDDNAALAPLEIAGPEEEQTRAHLRGIQREADRSVVVEATTARLPLSLHAWVRGADALVVCTDGLSQWVHRTDRPRDEVDVARTRLHVMEMDTSLLPLVLASWIGVGPAWAVQPAADTWPEGLFAERVDDPDLPAPQGADPALEQVWARMRGMWSVVARDPVGELGRGVFVHAGDRGQVALHDLPGQESAEPGDRLVQLGTLPPAVLFDYLVDIVGLADADREGS